jgi:uncharacterized hydantoinase/oxoprolinase family protein
VSGIDSAQTDDVRAACVCNLYLIDVQNDGVLSDADAIGNTCDLAASNMLHTCTYIYLYLQSIK